MTALDPDVGAVEAAYPLSPMQRGMLFHALLDRAEDDYVEQVSARLDGPLDTAAFRAAWADLLARHDVLRTSFHVLDRSEPAQLVHRSVPLPWVELDWSDADPDEQRRRLEELLAADRRQGFDPARAPLLRCTLVRLGPQAHRLLWTHHHLLLDGWSVPIVLRDLAELYAACRRGRGAQLTPPPPFRAYIDWLRRQDPTAAQRFWRAQLAGFDSPTPVPTTATSTVPDPASAAMVPAGTGAQPGAARTVVHQLDEGASAALATFARSRGLTLGTLVQAAWAIVLARHARTDDVVFGVTVSGRPGELRDAHETVGLFINTLPTRVRVDHRAPVGEWLAGLQAGFVAQRDFEYSALTDVHGWADVPRGVPLFESIVVHENQPLGEGTPLGELRFGEVYAAPRTNFALTLLSLPGVRHRLQLLVDPARVAPELAADLLAAVAAVLTGMVAAPERPVSGLALVTPADQQRIVSAAAGPVTDYPADDSLCRRFLTQAARTPDAVAVVDGERQTTYRALRECEQRIHGGLGAAGVGAGDCVGVVADRSVTFVAAVLGVLSCGAAYVPLDPDYPASRLAFMAADAGVRVVLADADQQVALGPGVTVLAVADLLAGAAARLPDRLPGGEAVAYRMYTSGSTGTPKGVAVPHRAVLRLVCRTDYVRFAPDDRVAFLSNTAFDAATFEIWGALLNGASLVVLRREQVLSASAFATAMREHGLTTLFVTAALFGQLVAERADLFAPARSLLVGGEAVDPDAAARALGSTGPPARLLNGYGPTETTTFACWHHIAEPPVEDTVPIGRALANSSAYVLDTAGQLAPDDLIGELCLGGDGLAHGYAGRPAATAERFVPDPFGDRPGARLYRTGDLARRGRDGAIRFLGRTDHQVKLRGHRIELGEIEAVLRAAPGVTSALALVRRDDDGDARLVAYVVAPDAPDTPDALVGELRRRCTEALAPAAVPGAIVVLDRLPLTPNGKLDRAALPAPGEVAAASAPAAGSSLREGVEQVIGGVWAELLDVPSVGAEDNFFALGGHSLLATRLQVRLRSALGVDVALRSIFTTTSLRELATELDTLRRGPGATSHEGPLVATGEPTAAPTFSQQRLWFLEQWDPGTALYHITGALRLHGRLDVVAVRAALTRIAERHEALRTTFATDDVGELHQRVAPPAPAPLPVLDLSGLAEPSTALERAVDAALRTPFDLAAGPLWRAVVVRLGSEDSVLALALHHLIADGRSLEILLAELGALLRDPAASLPELAAQYNDYARRQQDPARAVAWQDDLAYWRPQLRGIADVSTPRDHHPDAPALDAAREVVELGAGADDQLRALAARVGATPFMTTLAIFAVALAQTRDLPEVVVGTPVANRHRGELHELIGLFVNTVVLRVRVADGARTFLDVAQRARDTCLDAYDHQRLPFERVVAELRPDRRTDRLPLFQTWFVVHDPSSAGTLFPGMRAEPVSSPDRLARYDLRLDVMRAPAGIRAVFEYRAALFDAASIARLVRRFRAVFDTVTAQPGIELTSLAAHLDTGDEELRRTRRSTVTLSSLNRLQGARRRAVGPADHDLNGAPPA